MRMRVGLAVLLSLLLIGIFGCTANNKPAPPGPTPTAFTDDIAVDLLWRYELTLLTGQGDPYQFVTGLEQQWLDQYLKEKRAGSNPARGWRANGAVVKVNKVTAADALLDSQFESAGKTVTIQWKFTPANGTWKIANHQLPSGKWWAPGAK